MDYKEAVALALAGEERGYGYLYENTHKSKYYLALQYVQNETMAEDVVQEAYMKAFANLDKLEKPEVFPAWLGKIVANTAKNMLAKKTPMYFADVAVGEDGEGYEYQLEDEKLENQPELAYTKKETQELVHELIDSLSDEQRICVLMFHMEGASISEIAAEMNCSENTVKSRLSYGRKNIKARIEELEKKGYQLYNVAPLPLLLFLLRSEEQAMEADGTLMAIGNRIAENVFGRFSYEMDGTCRPGIPDETGNPYGGGNPYGTGKPYGTENPYGTGNQPWIQTMAEGMKTAGKTGLLHSQAAKIAVVSVAGILTVGTFFGLNRPKNPEPQPIQKQENMQNRTVVPATKSAVTGTPTTRAAITETPATEEPKEKEVADNEYSTLIEGNLTKEELEYVLAYGPEEITEQGYKEDGYTLYSLCEGGDFIKMYGKDSQYRYLYSLKDVNRFYSSFTDYQFTEENSNEDGGVKVEGNRLMFVPATLSYERTAHIISATYTPEEMVVYFDYEHMSYEEGTTTYKKKAVLLPLPNGKYRIHTIEIVTDESQIPSAHKSGEKAETTSVKDIYKGVLESVKKKEKGFTFSKGDKLTGEYKYFVADLNGDRIKELVVAELCTVDTVFEGYDFRIYSCEKAQNGYRLKRMEGEEVVQGLNLTTEKNKLYKMEFSRSGWEYGILTIVVGSDKFYWDSNQRGRTMSEEEYDKFARKNPSPDWKNISDLSGLDGQ